MMSSMVHDLLRRLNTQTDVAGQLQAWKRQPEMNPEWPAWWAWETRRALEMGK